MVNPDRNLYEPPYDDALLYDGDLEPERPRSRPLVVLLGTVVLAAFAGVVWVAYNQGVKQGQGVPLLRPMPVRRASCPIRRRRRRMNPAPDKSYERLWGEAPEGDGQVQVMPQAEQPRTIPAPQDVASTSLGGPAGAEGDRPSQPPDPRMDTTTGSVSSLPNSAPRSISNTPPALFGPKPQTEDITSELPPVESVSPPVSAPRSVAPSSLPSLTSPCAETRCRETVAPKPVALAQAPTPKPVAPASQSDAFVVSRSRRPSSLLRRRRAKTGCRRSSLRGAGEGAVSIEIGFVYDSTWFVPECGVGGVGMVEDQVEEPGLARRVFAVDPAEGDRRQRNVVPAARRRICRQGRGCRRLPAADGKRSGLHRCRQVI